jgi:rhamnulokinase
VQIIGGGGQNSYLNQATANASGLPVSAGPVEATIIGNVLVQSIAHGQFASLAEARAYVASKTQLKRFTPEVSASYEEAKRRYAVIETSFLALTV